MYREISSEKTRMKTKMHRDGSSIRRASSAYELSSEKSNFTFLRCSRAAVDSPVLHEHGGQITWKREPEAPAPTTMTEK